MSQADEVESSTDEKKYVGPRPLARWEEDDDGYKNVHVDEFLMEDRLNMAVEQIRKMIDFYDLRKGIKTDENAWPMRMKGYYQLLLALLRLEHEMDPDFAWYEKRVSFENGYGASIICKGNEVQRNSNVFSEDRDRDIPDPIKNKFYPIGDAACGEPRNLSLIHI